MINRRALGITAVVMLLATAFAINAQQPAKVPRIGFLGMDSGMQATRVAAFQDELRKYGYIDGRTVTIEYRWAEGHFDRLPGLGQTALPLAGREPAARPQGLRGRPRVRGQGASKPAADRAA